MTKVWDPNRKTKKTRWHLRPKSKKKYTPWNNKNRRDAALVQARFAAKRATGSLQRDAVTFWLRRANNFFPISQRQINNMIVLMGRTFMVQQGYVDGIEL